ncbi:hypothetical protein [Arthrobacter sp. KK5.5]|uniref:hypothetical protein n=1 Tax=Arthrobacter sp. KK5.5 TaxID=3373084 RepID=UPI003EE6ED18
MVWEDMERRALQADEYVAAARRSLGELHGLDWVSPAGVAFHRQLALLQAELLLLSGSVDGARHDVQQARVLAAALRSLRNLALTAAAEQVVESATRPLLPGMGLPEWGGAGPR